MEVKLEGRGLNERLENCKEGKVSCAVCSGLSDLLSRCNSGADMYYGAQDACRVQASPFRPV